MRVRTVLVILRKELIDILRDRRTLMAMVVVPIVLYPVLMLGSVQAVQFQTGRLQRETIHVGVPDEAAGRWLHQLFNVPAATSQPDEERPGPFEYFVVADPLTAVQKGAVNVAVARRTEPTDMADWDVTFPFVIYYDSAEIRSDMARSRFQQAIEQRRNELRSERLVRLLPEAKRRLLTPEPVQLTNVATAEKVGGSLLGNVLPLVLALMTITGAIYPAIDLTAGERERGTLETLMVAPVPVLDLIVGKFLVVAAVSLIAATLNLVSIGVTLQFGDVNALLTQGHNATIPVAVLPLVLLAMVPFAILFSAVLIAVSSFARTFKEAQNYVMPVIMAALIPGTAGALPGVELHGVMTVLPVANMVLLVRELLLGHFGLWREMLLALGSTCFYAVVAVIVAARLFGQEAVLFADSGSWKTVFRRRFFEPRAVPSATAALLLVTLMFPAWFHLQGQFGTDLGVSAALIVAVFGLVPLALAWYVRADIVRTFSVRRPRALHWIGAAAIGLASWVLGYELLVLQSAVVPMGESMKQLDEAVARQFASWSPAMVVLMIAIVPGVCEELTFRGFVLSGLRSRIGTVGAIVLSAALFAVFHMLVLRFAVTGLLGVLLGWLCWRSRSILPGMAVHAMHNAMLYLLSRVDSNAWIAQRLHLSAMDGAHHLPMAVIAVALALVVGGIVLVQVAPRKPDELDHAPPYAPAPAPPPRRYVAASPLDQPPAG